MTTGTCGTCLFRHYVWRLGDEYTHCPSYGQTSTAKRQNDFILCRKSPPVVIGDYQNGIDTAWPTVSSTDWCGEYVSRDGKIMEQQP